MIQRMQTIWLLLAAGCGFTTLKLPFYIGSIGTLPAENLTAMSNTFLMILTVGASLLALVAIFLYNNRKLQSRLAITGLIAGIINIILFILEVKKYTAGGIALFCVFSFAVPVFYILALRGIYKDDKLIKSVDRLR